MQASDSSCSEESESSRPRRAPWWLVGLGLVYFFRALFFEQVFFFRDLQNFFLPERGILAHLLRSGELPLLDPYLHGGVPLLANIGYTALYPSAWLYLWLPLTRALAWDLAGHVIFASLAAYALARTLRMSPMASCIVALSFAYGGYTLSQLNLFVRLLALPYLPLVLLSVHRWLSEGRRKWAVGAVATGALQLLAGAPDVVAVTWLTALLWAVWLRPADRDRRRAWLVPALPVAVLLVAAIQVLPLLELTASSTRGEGWSYDSLTAWSVAKRRLPELVLAGFAGRTDLRDANAYWGRDLIGQDRPYVLSLYLGALLLSLAGLGAWAEGRISRRLRLLLAALALLSIALALGRHLPGFQTLYRWLPVLHIFRYPVKFFGGAVLPLALLAGLGFDSLQSDRRCFRMAVLLGAAALIFLGVTGFSLGWPEGFARLAESYFASKSPSIVPGLRDSLARTGLVVGAAGLVCLTAAIRRRAWQMPAIVAILAVDLLTAGRPLNPVVPDSWFDEPAVASIVREHLGEGRIYRQPLLGGLQLEVTTGETLLADRWYLETLYAYGAAAYRLPTVHHLDFDGLAPTSIRQLTQAIDGKQWSSRLPLLRSAAVTVVLAQEPIVHPELALIEEIPDPTGVPIRLYALKGELEPVRFASRWISVDDSKQSLRHVTQDSFDPGQLPVIEDDRQSDSGLSCSDPALERIQDGISSERIRVVTDCPGYLVWSSTHLVGWKVLIDGQQRPLVRADHAFSAVWVDGGEHLVERVYRPTSVWIGAVVSALSIVGLALFGLADKRSARPSDEHCLGANGRAAPR